MMLLKQKKTICFVNTDINHVYLSSSNVFFLNILNKQL